MDETTRSIIERIKVRCDPARKLPDGRECTVFFDCARLSPNDLSRLAAHAVGGLEEGEFDGVVGLAYSGILFAAAVAGGKSVNILRTDGALWGEPVKGKRILVVDDVVFTTTRILDAVRRVEALGGKVVGLACVVDRSEGHAALVGLPLYSAYETALE